mmetsp:Transcript_20985/g.52347  ORF Transcript_20985/g.52347 Transcript_20985/m.52347 type:complete len:80 (-) Transcript_20985:177-416(-)
MQAHAKSWANVQGQPIHPNLKYRVLHVRAVALALHSSTPPLKLKQYRRVHFRGIPAIEVVCVATRVGHALRTVDNCHRA